MRENEDNSSAKYILQLNEQQAKIVSTACEFFARVKMGQFGEIVWHTADKHCPENPAAAEQAWLELRKQIYPDLQGVGHSYGIGKFPDADTAYDVHQALRFAMGGKEPFSYNELPTVTVIKDKEKK